MTALKSVSLYDVDMKTRSLICDAIAKAELDPDREALLEKMLGQDYEVITADDRLDKIATDFVEHCSARWESGKSMLVCIDKITCARMFQRIEPRWKAKLTELHGLIPGKEAELAAATDPVLRERLIALLTDAVRSAMARKEIATGETAGVVAWVIFAIYQVEIRRWLASGALRMKGGLSSLRRQLQLLVDGLSPRNR